MSCKAEYGLEWLYLKLNQKNETCTNETTVEQSKITPKCDKCKSVVKADVVLFNDPISADFYKIQKDLQKCDLAIIAGTSLLVQPFASIPSGLPENIERYLINKSEVYGGSFGSHNDDYWWQIDSEDSAEKLAIKLGFSDELTKEYENCKEIRL